MSYYRSSTSFLAIIEYWNQKKLMQYRQLIPPDWDVYFYPAGMMYVRPLTAPERISSGYDGDVADVWYGAFHHITGELVVVSDAFASLMKGLHSLKVQFVLVH